MSAADGQIREDSVSCGGLNLYRRIAQPQSASARLLVVHGYGEHSGRYVHFMQWLAAREIAAEALDLRGHGKSPGRRGFVRRWEEYLDDLDAFVAVPRDSLPTFVLGHSHGGLIAAAAGERDLFSRHRVGGCILCSPYLQSSVPVPFAKRAAATVFNRLVPSLKIATGLRPEWRSTDPAMLAEDHADTLMNRTATPRWYLSMLKTQQEVSRDVASFKTPLLCLIGEGDAIANPMAMTDFFRNCGSADKSVYSYPNRLHELLREVDRERVFADILGWMNARSGARSITPADFPCHHGYLEASATQG